MFRETQRDVSLRIERVNNKEEWIVSGRGELHLSILMENLRREGYEFQVSRPRVILKEIDGKTCEPYEYVQVDTPDEYIGPSIEMLGNRRGILESMDSRDGQTRLIYTVPSKGLIGFMTDFLTATHGYGIINHTFLDYRPIQPEVFTGRKKQMTNQRSATKDTTVVLKKPRVFSLENYLAFIDDDELVEVTPKNIRLRKLILDTVERKKFDSTKLKKH